MSLPEKMKRLAILESARVSLAYIWLEMNNLNSVIRISELVLKESTIYAYSDADNGMEENTSECPASQRRRSTMQKYASEAMQKLGIFSSEEPQDVQINSFGAPNCNARRTVSGAGTLKSAPMESIS